MMTLEEKREKSRLKAKKWRLANPEKVKISNKKTDSNPKRKEKHRMRMKLSRELNPEKYREIANKCYHKNKDIHRERRNSTKRKHYLDNKIMYSLKAAERYKNKRIASCISCGGELPYEAQKYCKKCVDNEYKKTAGLYRNKVGKDYINSMQNKRVKKRVDELSDVYVIQLINRSNKIEIENIPKELIETKRNIIKIKRIINQSKNK